MGTLTPKENAANSLEPIIGTSDKCIMEVLHVWYCGSMATFTRQLHLREYSVLLLDCSQVRSTFQPYAVSQVMGV